MIDQSRVADGILFATHADRAMYLGTSTGKRARWLQEHPDRWRCIPDVRQEAAPLRPRLESEIDVGAIPTGPNSQASPRDLRNDGNDDDAGSAAIAAGDRSPPQAPAPAKGPRAIDAAATASIDESEIEIGGRRYVSAQRLAELLGVSPRTLSRWDAAGTGPPKIKVGRKVVFDLGKIPQWLATRELSSTRVTGQH